MIMDWTRDLLRALPSVAIGLLVAQLALARTKAADNELVAAVPADFPPHYLLDGDGRPAGYAIDTMNRLAEDMGVGLRYSVKADWGATMDALRRGEADLIPNLGITADRQIDFDFTAPLETIALGLFVRAVNTDIHGMQDMGGKPVAVVKRNAAVKLIQDYPQLDARLFDHQEQALFALLSGEVESLIYPISVTWKMAAEIGVDGKIRQVGLPLKEIKRAIAVRRGNTDLLSRLDGAVRQYANSEHYRETYTRWHARSQPFWTPQRVLRYGAGVAVMLLLMTVIAMWWWRYRSLLKLNRQLQASLDEKERAESEVLRLREQLGESD